jgi:hypothetical protein
MSKKSGKSIKEKRLEKKTKADGSPPPLPRPAQDGKR